MYTLVSMKAFVTDVLTLFTDVDTTIQTLKMSTELMR